MSKDIEPRNKLGQWHGYCEQYGENGNLFWKGVYVNDYVCGYYESYNFNGSVREEWSGYYSHGNFISANNEKGYCIIWNKVEL